VSALRRLLLRARYAISVLTLLALAAPCALRAAADPLRREFGGLDEHVCKCGMKPGKCGCPDCAKLEEERRAERAPSPLPVLRLHCDDDAPAMPLGAPLVSGVLAGALTNRPTSAGGRVPIARAGVPLSSADIDPPTPPPRLAAA
jgi:hypothetical protein